MNQIEQALHAVEEAKSALAKALDVLREARGEAPTEPCKWCQGSGKDAWAKMMGRDEPCDRCECSGVQLKTFPWIVTSVKWDSRPLTPSLLHRGVTWVSIRPCAEECEGKTYLGWLLGDMAISQTCGLSPDGELTISMAHHKPAIFVPDLKRIVFGCESWWSALKTPDDLRKITDSDIENVWYVKTLQDLVETSHEKAP